MMKVPEPPTREKWAVKIRISSLFTFYPIEVKLHIENTTNAVVLKWA